MPLRALKVRYNAETYWYERAVLGRAAMVARLDSMQQGGFLT